MLLRLAFSLLVTLALELAGRDPASAQDSEFRCRQWPEPSGALESRLEIGSMGFVVPLTGPGDAAERYRALFSERTKARFTFLSQSPERSLALQAAWELAVFDGLPGPDAVSQQLRSPRDPWGQLESFVEVAQKVLGVEAPYWWMRALADRFVPPHRTSEAGFAMRFAAQKNVEVAESGVSITVEGVRQHYPFGKEWSEWGSEHLDLLSPSFAVGPSGDHFVAVTQDEMNASRVACFEAGQKVRWMTTLWGTGASGWRWRSYGFSRVVLSSAGVVVFGSYPSGEFAELFDASTGECRARFSTSYWTIADYIPSKAGDVRSPLALKPPVRFVRLQPIGHYEGLHAILRDSQGAQFSIHFSQAEEAGRTMLYFGYPSGGPLESEQMSLSDQTQLVKMLQAALRQQFQPAGKPGRLRPRRPGEFEGQPAAAVGEAATRLQRLTRAAVEFERARRLERGR
ncbi:MAG: hypothetical protein JSR82_23810 [Verrucomicrobia bacterium]|nr:hypothetical protein [Verrucomicrobiota bacterium]